MALSTKKLIALGKSVLEAFTASDDEAIIELVDHYVENFDKWNKNPPTEDKKNMGELLKIHTLIIKQVSEVQARLSKNLQNLKKRGKGLRAYIDPLPKRISVRKSRKG